MKLSVSHLDEEIRQVENRIALERIALDDAIAACTNSLRVTVASPKTLLALAGIGFVIGKLMFGRKAPPQQVVVPQKTGLLGLLTGLAGTAVSLMQPGLVGSIARWAATKAFEEKPAARPGPPPTTPSATEPKPGTRPRVQVVS